MAKGDHIEKLNEDDELEQSDKLRGRKSSRLNTNMDVDLQKRLDQRRVDGHGTKTEQLEHATRIYLALFEGYGEVSGETLAAMERLVLKNKN